MSALQPTPALPPPPAAAQELDLDRSDPAYRPWLREAVGKVHADANRSADTHLLSVPLPAAWGVDLYLKDESTHPTGSLKHRLARSLFLYALCNGWIRPSCPVIEASSGSTAVSEANFARLISVPFVAVMARGAARAKVELIEFHGFIPLTSGGHAGGEGGKSSDRAAFCMRPPDRSLEGTVRREKPGIGRGNECFTRNVCNPSPGRERGSALHAD